MSQKSMALSLLCLIGLRRNQIESDNCVPVTFPPRQADRVGRRGPRGERGNLCSCVCTVVFFWSVYLGRRDLLRRRRAVATCCTGTSEQRAKGEDLEPPQGPRPGRVLRSRDNVVFVCLQGTEPTSILTRVCSLHDRCPRLGR